MSGTVVRNFEIKDLASRQSRFIIALVAAILAIAAVVLRLSLWRYDLRVPITYNGDALYETVMVNGLIEGRWNYHIARLGAPFGMDAVDFPIGCSLDFAIIKILSLALREPGLLINVYWLLSIGLAGAFAALFFRWLRMSPLASVAFGVLYAIIPFAFYRNIAHLNLVHFIIPGAAYLGLSLARGGNCTLTHSGSKTQVLGHPSMPFLICLAVGFTYIYWAFFACIMVAVGCIIGVFRSNNSWSILRRGLVYVSIISIAAVADISASLVYWYRHGSNTALKYKYAAEADIYGLKIRQTLAPIHENPVKAFRKIREKIDATGFPNDNNGSVAAALGVAGDPGELELGPRWVLVLG